MIHFADACSVMPTDPFTSKSQMKEPAPDAAQIHEMIRGLSQKHILSNSPQTGSIFSFPERFFGTRLVDEYETEFRLPQQTSRRPFSLGGLIRFLNSVEEVDRSEPSQAQFGSVLFYNQRNLEGGTDLETLRDFIRVGSDYYPDLAAHYAKAIEQLYEACLAEQAE
jgi:hypothetical protein